MKTVPVGKRYVTSPVFGLSTFGRFVATVGRRGRDRGVIEVAKLGSNDDPQSTWGSPLGLFIKWQQEHSTGVKAIAWGGDALWIVGGDFDGRITLYNTDSSYSISSVQGTEAVIHQVVTKNAPSPAVLSCCSSGGEIALWDIRQLKNATVSITCSKKNDKPDCWSSSFDYSGNYVSGGYSDGYIRTFDLRKNSMVSEVLLGKGVCSVEYDKSNSLLATTLNGECHLYNNTGKTKRHDVLQSSDSTMWCAKQSPTHPNLCAASDQNGIMYFYNKKDKLKKLHEICLSPTNMPITTFDWFADCPGLMVYTPMDQTIGLLALTNINGIKTI
mmetsp:Transcript_18553/g.20632  ORF Transcript_18553/g.20632 Transcript_18553/m.20632 type:complete len:328 (+) Transcript_18553:65-1048(+)